jgi:NADPH-dependent ferric siderophore reductase
LNSGGPRRHDRIKPTTVPVAVPDQSTVGRLLAALETALPALRRPGEELPTLLPINPPITPEEASALLRAIDHGVFKLMGTGQSNVQSG